MSTEAERLAESRKSMFPKGRVWFARWKAWGWPIGKGCDEWARHTLWISVPYVITVIVAYKWCDCEDMVEFDCSFPGCPAKGWYSVPYQPTRCPSHDEASIASYIAGEYEDVIA